jgi:hypothetical protein
VEVVGNPRRRRASSIDLNESNSYEPPRRNRGRNEVATPVQRIPKQLTEFDRVQKLLCTFGSIMNAAYNISPPKLA